MFFCSVETSPRSPLRASLSAVGTPGIPRLQALLQDQRAAEEIWEATDRLDRTLRFGFEMRILATCLLATDQPV